jgi:hypothetical protein
MESEKYGEGRQIHKLSVAEIVGFIFLICLGVGIAVYLKFAIVGVKAKNIFPLLESCPCVMAILALPGLVLALLGSKKDLMLYRKAALIVFQFDLLATSIMLTCAVANAAKVLSVDFTFLMVALILDALFNAIYIFFVFTDIFLPFPALFILSLRIASYVMMGGNLIALLLGMMNFLNSIDANIQLAYLIAVISFACLGGVSIVNCFLYFLFPEALEDGRIQIVSTFRK